MHTTSSPRSGNSLLSLIENLRDDVRNLFHEEVNLAKKELSEKAARLGRNAAFLGAGGAIAYLAVNALLISLAFLIAAGCEKLGLGRAIALFLGFVAIALVSGAIGAVLVMKALKAFSKETLAPEKTLESLREIKAGGLEQTPVRVTYHTPEPPEDKRSSDQVKSDIDHTRSRIHQEVTVLRRRLRVAQVATGVVNRVTSNPLRSFGIGIVGLMLMRMTRLFGRRRAV